MPPVRMLARCATSRARRSPGISLLEVVLSTVVAAVFLSAFMGMFGVQQLNFRALQDEISVPIAGDNLLSLMFGPTGVLNATNSASIAIATDLLLEPADVSLAANPGASAPWRALAFVPAPAPNPLQLGTIAVQQQGGALTDLAPPTAVATMSFFVPDLFTAPGLVTYPVTTFSANVPAGLSVTATVSSTAGFLGATLSIDDGPNEEQVKVLSVPSGTTFTANFALPHSSGAPVGSPAFYILGATVQPGDGLPNASLGLNFEQLSGGTTWQFNWPPTNTPSTVTFSPGGMFALNGENKGDGQLICAFPAADATQSGTPESFFPATLPGLNALTVPRRIGVWLQMNSSSQAGLQMLRDELFLRD